MYPTRLNDSGQVLGIGLPTGRGAGFLYEDGAYRTLFEGGGAWPAALNNRGDAVGSADGRVLLWADGQMIDITPPGELEGLKSWGIDVNENRLVLLAHLGRRRILWRDGQYVDMGDVYGSALNEREQVVGYFSRPRGYRQAWENYAVLWQDGRRTELGAPSGFADSKATGISNSGDVVGTAYTLGAGVARAAVAGSGREVPRAIHE